MKIKALIVDDEAIARDRVRRFLNAESSVEIVGECRDGREAVAAIQSLKPDLVLLDVQMPEMSGFDVLESLGSHFIPAIIFITAYDQYAMRAFEVHALDYLLKPFTQERFRQSLKHARSLIEHHGQRDMDARLLALLEDFKGKEAARKYADRLVVKSAGRVYFVKASDIDWIEACGNYVNLHAGADTHLLRETLSHLESRLDPDQFLRIHRSRLVNIDRIKELSPLFNGDYSVILNNGTELTLSRTYRDRLQELIDKHS